MGEVYTYTQYSYVSSQQKLIEHLSVKYMRRFRSDQIKLTVHYTEPLSNPARPHTPTIRKSGLWLADCWNTALRASGCSRGLFSVPLPSLF